MRRGARRELRADGVDELIRSWAVMVEVDCDGPAQVVAAGAELTLEITSGPLVSVLATVVEAARRARGSALLCVVESGGASSFVVTGEGRVLPAAPVLAERDVAVILTDRPPCPAPQLLHGEVLPAEDPVGERRATRRHRHRRAADFMVSWRGRWART